MLYRTVASKPFAFFILDLGFASCFPEVFAFYDAAFVILISTCLVVPYFTCEIMGERYAKVGSLIWSR